MNWGIMVRKRKSIRSKGQKRRGALIGIAGERDGAAMIAVLCIMAVFVALAFAILLAASSAAMALQGTLPEEKCKIMAVSLSDVLTRELKEAGLEENELQAALHEEILEGTWEQSGDGARIYENLAEEEKEAGSLSHRKKYFEVEDVPEDYQAQAVMVWGISQEENAQEDMPEGESAEDSYEGARLYLMVTCKLRGQTGRVKSRYVLRKSVGTEEERWRWELEWRE